MSVIPAPGADQRPALCSDEVMQQYGVIPWRTKRGGAIRILLITSRRRGRWIVPKGWLIEGRPPFLSAALEVFEEAGVIGNIHSHAMADYHYLKAGKDGSLRRCRVILFSLRVRGTLTNWPERGQRKRRWVTLDEATEMVDDAELAQVIQTVRAMPWMLTQTVRGPAGVPDAAATAT